LIEIFFIYANQIFLSFVGGLSDEELIDSETTKGSKSSLNKRSSKYERTRGNGSKNGHNQAMQCLNPMKLGPPASKTKGETFSSKMLLSNSGTKLLGKTSENQGSSTLPNVPTYTQSLLDIDCEGGYNVSPLSPSNNDIPLISSPSLTPSANVQEEKSVVQFSSTTQTIG
jgi:hypothetical protein